MSQPYVFVESHTSESYLLNKLETYEGEVKVGFVYNDDEYSPEPASSISMKIKEEPRASVGAIPLPPAPAQMHPLPQLGVFRISNFSLYTIPL